MGSSLSFLPATGFALLLEQTKRLYHTGIKPERPLAPRRAAAVEQKHTQEHQSLPRQRWGRQKWAVFQLHGLWIHHHQSCTWCVCLWSNFLPSSSQFSFINISTGCIFTQPPLCSAVWSSIQEVPSLGARWLYAWKSHTLGLLESYPAGVSKSQSPITAAFTIVALTLPITSWVATSRFLKALKNKSWVLNVSAIVLQFVILLGEYVREER